MKSSYEIKFNNTVIAALMCENIVNEEKEKRLQKFVNSAETLYDDFCDNIYYLLDNKKSLKNKNTLYVASDGTSFIDCFSFPKDRFCFPVLIINQYSPDCSDLSTYIETALHHFVSCVSLLKTLHEAS